MFYNPIYRIPPMFRSPIYRISPVFYNPNYPVSPMFYNPIFHVSPMFFWFRYGGNMFGVSKKYGNDIQVVPVII